MQYMIRIFKSWQTRSSQRRWVNNYEVEDPAASVTALHGTALGLLGAERQIHLVDVQFLGYTISTWAPDSEPYNPNNFVSTGSTLVGLRAPASANAPLDTNVAYFVQRNASTGRQGKLFFRGVLTEADVDLGSDGFFKIVVGSDIDAPGASWQAARAAYGPYLPDGAATSKLILMSVVPITNTTYNRPVMGLSPAGVVINRRNHRYFDRALG